MYFLPTLFTLFALSFSSPSAASGQQNENAIRVALERKSLIVSSPSPDQNTRDFGARSDVAGYVNVDLLKAQVANIATKYRTTLAAYQLNTGFVHPLEEAISAISPGFLAPDQSSSGVAITSPPRKLEKRRRKGDVRLRDIPTHSKRDDISLTEINSNMWMGTITVGTPPQNFKVDFDTGSADFILPSEGCDSSCNGHTRYNLTASSTSLNLDKTFQIAYSGGSNVNGTQYADNVFMGGYEAVNQTLGAATTYSSGLETPTFVPDGLLGMGFPVISSLHASPVFQTMVSNGAVPQAVFALALSSDSGKSELTIGGTNTAMYQPSTVEYVDLSLPAYWQLRFAGLSRPGLNNTPDVVVVNQTSYAQSIIDSGTTLIITSDSCAQQFYANVPGASDVGGGIWSVPCDTVGQLAPTLTYGSRNFTVSSATFNLGPVSPGSTNCIAGLAGGGSPYWIIGDVFLQNVYTIFDVGNTRIGFADLA